MPNRDPDEPQDPLAQDDDIVGVADDEDDDLEDLDDEEEDLEEDALSHAEFTAEVGSEGGSEGGSPGEAVEVARPRGAERDAHGSEATETWRPAETTEATEPDIIDHRDPRDRGLMKDAPN